MVSKSKLEEMTPPLYRLSIDSAYTLEQAWNSLEAIGIDVLYGSEDEEGVELFVYLASLEILKPFAWITACEPCTLPPIDWQSQWEMHGHDYQDGHVHVDFSGFGRSGTPLMLKPGAGFGDLSHATTHLMLRILAKYLKNQIVIDVGCGSGILTFSALAMGAPLAYGIDIDPQALDHSCQNALLNHLERQSHFYLPSEFKWNIHSQAVLVLMNMIRTEQYEAWNSLNSLHHQPCEVITSGIRIEEREMYLDQAAAWGWSLKNEQEEKGWLAFYFTQKASCKPAIEQF